MLRHSTPKPHAHPDWTLKASLRAGPGVGHPERRWRRLLNLDRALSVSEPLARAGTLPEDVRPAGRQPQLL